jgi:adenylate cyclase
MAHDCRNHMTRRLAAILAADVADYSRLMHEDEEATHSRFTEIMNGAIEPAISQHGGRIVKSTGDGFLAEFASAVEGVQCALQFQDAITRISANDEPERRLTFRVGIHIGEVIVEDRDIYGDGVNIAARLESLAAPGGIMVSEPVHENVRGRVSSDFEDLGTQQVKNIARPVRLFRAMTTTAATQRASRRPALVKRPSIVVLPFHNLSGDPAQDSLADGIVEDIITALSRFRWLFVISRNSAFTYKGRAVDVRQVGRELEARYVVEGSVRKLGNRLRITGQAIETDTGASLWAERFDRDLSDDFALQDEMTASAVSALVPIVRRAEIERALRKPLDRGDAYDLYLHALAAHRSRTREGNEKALALLDQALALEPHFVPALLLVDTCCAAAVAKLWVSLDAVPTTFTRALRHARLAVQLAPEDADALSALALRTAATTRDDEQAMTLAERAVAINPHSTLVLDRCGYACFLVGRAEQALELFERELRLRVPDRATAATWSGIGYASLALGRDAEAIEAGRRAAQHDPESADAFRVLAAGLALSGRSDDAGAAMRRLLELDPAGSIATIKLRFGVREAVASRLFAGLRRAGLPEAPADTPRPATAVIPAEDPEGTFVQLPRRQTGREPRHVLVVSRPGERDREVPIGTAPLLLGRSPESDVVLTDAQVSRAHCRILLEDDAVTATDLNSTNGTLLNGRLIDRPIQLEPGAVLRIGPYDVEYQRREPADPESTMLAGPITPERQWND